MGSPPQSIRLQDGYPGSWLAQNEILANSDLGYLDIPYTHTSQSQKQINRNPIISRYPILAKTWFLLFVLDLLLVQEEDLLLVQEEGPLLVQEEDLLLVQEEDLLLVQEGDLLLVQEENPGVPANMGF